MDAAECGDGNKSDTLLTTSTKSEVSLPGADENDSLEQPTIIEVVNRVNTTPDKSQPANLNEANAQVEDCSTTHDLVTSLIKSESNASVEQGPPNVSNNATNDEDLQLREDCAADIKENIKLIAKSLVHAIEAEALKAVNQRSTITNTFELQPNSIQSENLSSDSKDFKQNTTSNGQQLKIVDVPSPESASEAVERKLFIESLPQIESGNETESYKPSDVSKREYYQSLKKYFVHNNEDKPQVPLQTYRWEDLRRAKERGGYPWTHLYKRPLGPNEEPEVVLLLRKSQELRFASESPKSLKKVRIDELVSVKRAERYIQELSADEDEHNPSTTEDEENQSLHSESISCVSDSVLGGGKPRKSKRLDKIRGILKIRRTNQHADEVQSLPSTSTNTSRQHSIDNISQQRTRKIAGKSPSHKTPRCYPILKKLKNMADQQKKRLNIKRITLKKNEKIVLEEETKILKLKNSPKFERSEIPHFVEKQDSDELLEIVELDESPSRKRNNVDIDNVTEETDTIKEETNANGLPKKAPRLRRDHVYEEIDQCESVALNSVIGATTVEALKQSLAQQDTTTLKDIAAVSDKPISIERMGSSEEETITAEGKQMTSLLAPMSSIESASSTEDDRARLQLSPVAEESDAGSTTDNQHFTAHKTTTLGLKKTENQENVLQGKEASPAPSDKKVTFSHIEDEAEPHREDIELPDDVKQATAKKWKNMSDHEYEPIGDANQATNLVSSAEPVLAMETDVAPQTAEELQRDLEERYFSSETTTPRTESRTDYEIHTSQVDSSALEELPLKPENRRRGLMASAQERTRKMQADLRQQAGKLKTKLRSPAKKPSGGSPIAKERKRFRAPEFSKIKMPDIKRPDLSKLKEFKRPEFTKFNKPDMSKFKLPEKISTLRLKRSKSFKENESTPDTQISSTLQTSADIKEPPKKMFDFHFGTYPRAFRKKKPKPIEPELSLGTEGPSIIPSTDTQPSIESSSSPQGDRGPGPVRSRWADKFSDVSYNDSEGSRYRRFGSEQESFDRESSLERRMKEDLEEGVSDTSQLGILGGVADSRQFADFDEENRAIHEISNLRAGEFKRRPMIHQDSDLRSEDSKEAEGWTDKEIQKNKLLRQAELEAEASFLKYPSDEGTTHETQSTASSGKKVVMEEIDDDEFFLRKRGISEDNIELRQYISNAIREGYDMPINALQHVGQTSENVANQDYVCVPPPKPRRLHKNYQPDDESQDFEMQRSDFGDNLSVSQNESDIFGAPRRPMRKGRSRSKFSVDSQDLQIGNVPAYFDDDEDYLRPPLNKYNDDFDQNDLDFNVKEVEEFADNERHPQPPRRRKRDVRESSIEKNSYINGFGGRSVSNSHLQPQNDVIVYRTEHQYQIPLATPENYTDGASRRSRSTSRLYEDDRTSRGADSLALDAHLRTDFEDDSAQDKFIIDMMENDGYAVVRKEHMPKPTPPARRKKFSRSPGERFATAPGLRSGRTISPPLRPPPPREYTPSTDHPIQTNGSMDVPENYVDDDYKELDVTDRVESPRNLQSGAIMNKMKYRPLPPPPPPPREKRQRGDRNEFSQNNFDEPESGDIATSSTADSYDHNEELDEKEQCLAEVEVSTQTDPLPDDFVCEEFEITDDMKVIEPRRITLKTLDEFLKDNQVDQDIEHNLSENEQLARGLQRFRDANQRSLSEKSRTSSQADRKSLSRPQTPSAIVIERRVSTPVPNQHSEPVIEATLTVKPIDDVDLDLEEEALRREGLLTDSSQHSKSDLDLNQQYDAGEQNNVIQVNINSDLSDLDAMEKEVLSQDESELEKETERDDAEVERTMLNYEYDEETSKERFSNDYEDETDTSDKAVIASFIEKEEIENSAENIDLDVEEKEETGEETLKYDTSYPNVEEEKHILSQQFESSEENVFLEEPPLPPPRRKSTTAIERPSSIEAIDEQQQFSKEVTDVTSPEQKIERDLPTHLGDLEVDRLCVHALQARNIMVANLHGAQITSDELECKSGNLIVKNIELPPGFIEDIVERVRISDRSQSLAAETQTIDVVSTEALPNELSSYAKRETLPPPKPPRTKDLEQLPQVKNLDEETQTERIIDPQPIYPTTEYLKSLAPLAFYRQSRGQADRTYSDDEIDVSRRRRRHHRKRDVSNSDENDSEADKNEASSTVGRRHRTRSDTQPAETQTIAQAGRQFVTACSLSLVNILNRLTTNMRLNGDTLTRTRHVPTTVVIFIAISFVLLLFLLSGKNVHTHHWDFFNPPGNGGRTS